MWAVYVFLYCGRELREDEEFLYDLFRVIRMECDVRIFSDRRYVRGEYRESIGQCIGECRSSSIVSTECDPSTRILVESDAILFGKYPHDLDIVHDIESADTL